MYINVHTVLQKTNCFEQLLCDHFDISYIHKTSSLEPNCSHSVVTTYTKGFDEDMTWTLKATWKQPFFTNRAGSGCINLFQCRVGLLLNILVTNSLVNAWLLTGYQVSLERRIQYVCVWPYISCNTNVGNSQYLH